MRVSRHYRQAHLGKVMIEGERLLNVELASEHKTGTVGVAPIFVGVMTEYSPGLLLLRHGEDYHFDKATVAQSKPQLQSDLCAQPQLAQCHDLVKYMVGYHQAIGLVARSEESSGLPVVEVLAIH